MVDKKKTKISWSARRKRIDAYLAKAGLNLNGRQMARVLVIIAAIVWTISYIAYLLQSSDPSWQFFVSFTAVAIIVGIPLAMLVSTLGFYVYTDMRIISRKRAIEKVLPEFLHLTAANIRAGMPIDQALWSAVRPRFGALAHEVELVAKENMVGTELTDALMELGRKYDSKVLQRSLSLIVEGIDAGSEIGDLLEKIALNIQDMQIRRESMAANVTAYIIFIGFAVLIGAPLLFGVSIQLLRIVHALGGSLAGGSGGGVAGVSFSLSATAVGEMDFFIFCIVSLVMTSIMSCVIMSGIKTGEPTDAMKNIPTFVAVSLLLFFITQWGLGLLFNGLI